MVNGGQSGQTDPQPAAAPHLARVAVLQPRHQLLQEVGGLRLAQPLPRPHVVQQAAIGGVLQHQQHVGVRVDHLKHLDHAGVAEAAVDAHLRG